MFLAGRAQSVISIENWPDWYDQVSGELKRRGLENVDLRLVPHDKGNDPNVRDPSTYSSNSGNFKHRIFRSYVQEIDKSDELFDLVLVDGRARGSCMMHAYSHVAKGGCVVLDDSERGWYKVGWCTYKKPLWQTRVLAGKAGGTTHVFTRNA